MANIEEYKYDYWVDEILDRPNKSIAEKIHTVNMLLQHSRQPLKDGKLSREQMRKFFEHVDFLIELRDQSNTGQIGKQFLKGYRPEKPDLDQIEREKIKNIEACMEQLQLSCSIMDYQKQKNRNLDFKLKNSIITEMVQQNVHDR